MPPKYTSRAVIVRKRPGQQLEGQEQGRGNEARVDVRGVMEWMFVYESVMEVIKYARLDENIRENDQRAMEKLYNDVIRDTNVHLVANDLVSVSYSGDTPEQAFRVVDGLVNRFIERSLRHAREAAEKRLEFIRSELESLRAVLQSAEQAIENFRQANAKHLMHGSDVSIIQQKIQALEYQMQDMDREIQNKRYNLELQQEKLESTPEFLPHEIRRRRNPRRVELAEKLAQAQSALSNLQLTFTEAHPHVQQVKKRIEMLEEALAREPEAEEEAIEGRNPEFDRLKEEYARQEFQLKQSLSRKRELEERLQELEELETIVPELHLRLVELRRDYSTKKTTYEKMLDKEQGAKLHWKLTLDGQTSYSLFEAPRESQQRDIKQTVKIIAMSIMLGLGISFGMIFGSEYVDQSFTTVDECRNFLRVPSLGIIPMISTAADVRRKRIRLAITAVTLAVVLMAAVAVVVGVRDVNQVIVGTFRELFAIWRRG
jgi:polysaccharide chain length determinant protein (PEP-CTERM system associated)